ncbi:hypothetical protein [Pseudonocardia endophytica]|uniref:Transmembrane protein n=1 Tax=Pseudonocardia endophytica TaxID=401976 RepID=A0A4R1HG72_PSEEN|nr:hypothetical protein [Pseudonocardia endophytica]TCK21147.1 hypothetical protein EV378_5126 [Pseudonocardia endophytica]
MSNPSELDQVAEARRRIAAHAQFPRVYWVLYVPVLVLITGMPLWMSYLPGSWTYLSWALAAVALASAAYSVTRRRRSGVQLARGIGAYPSARKYWLAGIVVAIGGYVALHQLVGSGHRGIGLALLVPIAVVVFVTQVATRSAMRADIEAGRVLG